MDLQTLLPTSVVGSFPLENTPANMTRAFEGELDAGIDVPCYPQLVDMIDFLIAPLAERCPGCFERRGKEWYLRAPFEVPAEPFALEYGQFVQDYMAEHPAARDAVQGVKACLTGPFTLAGAVILDEELARAERVKPFIFQEPRAVMVPALLEQFARLMARIGRAYSDMGFDVVTMDEPTLSLITGRRRVFTYTADYAGEVLATALAGVTTTSSVHVCGRIPPLLKDLLLQSPVDIMDHEFANGDNLDQFTRAELEAHDKYLAFGVVDTKVGHMPGKDAVADYVEPVGRIKKFIAEGVSRYGATNLFIKPDCGLGGLLGSFEPAVAYDVAFGKLKNMVQATREIRATL